MLSFSVVEENMFHGLFAVIKSQSKTQFLFVIWINMPIQCQRTTFNIWISHNVLKSIDKLCSMNFSTILHLPEMLLRRTSRMVWPSPQWSSLRLTKLIKRRSGWVRMSEILDSSLLKLVRLFLIKDEEQNKLKIQMNLIINLNQTVIVSTKF